MEQSLNSLEGEIIAIIPNVAVTPFILTAQVDFLLIVEWMFDKNCQCGKIK